MKSFPLFIIDNVSSTREYLIEIFQKESINVECFNSAESFLYEVDSKQLGCIILDNRLPGIDGITLQERLNSKQSPLGLIYHSDSISTAAAVKAMKLGAFDILGKSASKECLLHSVEKGMALSQQKAINIENQKCLQSLTKKESIILSEILNGLTNQRIADRLCISLRTVEVHRANIMQKFNASNAVVLAYELAKII